MFSVELTLFSLQSPVTRNREHGQSRATGEMGSLNSSSRRKTTDNLPKGTVGPAGGGRVVGTVGRGWAMGTREWEIRGGSVVVISGGGTAWGMIFPLRIGMPPTVSIVLRSSSCEETVTWKGCPLIFIQLTSSVLEKFFGFIWKLSSPLASVSFSGPTGIFSVDWGASDSPSTRWNACWGSGFVRRDLALCPFKVRQTNRE